MRIVLVLALPLLVSAAPSRLSEDPMTDKALEKMGAYDGGDPTKEPVAELPDYDLKCEFQHRSVCAGGELCKSIDNPAGTYVILSKPRMTYSRCDNKGCGEHRITAIGAPQVIRNVVLADAGVLVKFGPRNRIIDIATKGSMVFISDGRCVPK